MPRLRVVGVVDLHFGHIRKRPLWAIAAPREAALAPERKSRFGSSKDGMPEPDSGAHDQGLRDQQSDELAHRALK
jgi:hypothetical protein